MGWEPVRIPSPIRGYSWPIFNFAQPKWGYLAQLSIRVLSSLLYLTCIMNITIYRGMYEKIKETILIKYSFFSPFINYFECLINVNWNVKICIYQIFCTIKLLKLNKIYYNVYTNPLKNSFIIYECLVECHFFWSIIKIYTNVYKIIKLWWT